MNIVTDYDKQAKAFLEKFRIELSIKPSFRQEECPPWAKKPGCHGDHGKKYIITLKHLGPILSYKEPVLSFPFWGSLRDKANQKDPSAYDVLACLSSDVSCPTDPDEVYEEFGEMKPSQAKRIAEFAKKLQEFFTKTELEALQEIY